jgi:predicted MFS family arabinose efflux permease
MQSSTLRLLVPIVAVTIQSNSASTIIPPYLDDIGIPVAAIGGLVSLSPIFALLSRLPMGMLYESGRARLLITVAVLAMGCTNFLYSFTAASWSFAVVHSLNGFAYGAVTTLYMAFYVDSLSPEENRNHAMGYYVGSLALGYSTGNFFGGLIADRWAYSTTYQLGALLSFVAVGLLWLLGAPAEKGGRATQPKRVARLNSRESLKALIDPQLATVVIVALFLNLLHQMGGVFISLYGLAVGMNLTQIGIIRAAYAGCNAVTRPISGHVVNRIGHRGLSYFGFPLQALLLMLVPGFTGFTTILLVYVASGLLRAVVLVANAVGLVQDVPEHRVGRGVSSGVYNAAGDFGNILGPAIGGLIAHAAGIGSVFVIGSFGSTVLFLIGIALARRLERNKRA